MADETRPDAGDAPNPWAPPDSRPSLSKSTDAAPAVHDMPTMAAMPGADGVAPPQAPMSPQASTPPQGYAPPGFGPAGGTPAAHPADGMLPPPPLAPTGPGAGGYGYPAYPAQGWPGAPGAQNGLGTAAMVLGIISCALFCAYGVLSVVLGILAIVFGVKARKRVERGEATNPGQAQAGLIMGIIGTILGILVMILLVIGVATAITHSDDSVDHDSYGAARMTQSVVQAR
ncbi:DUF4190 domain-containing protein [Streptomyces sp. NPDC048664]|uniref:DUF4190 domain-containing protein n=1 Tax=Streptomyces sp. NPDC048664 TaxID=3154505 RepID=UPI0034216B0D